MSCCWRLCFPQEDEAQRNEQHSKYATHAVGYPDEGVFDSLQGSSQAGSQQSGSNQAV
jgi:hypothetical protein